jgi:hypothetical protein
MELLAIRLSEQKTLAKSLVMSGHPHGPLLQNQTIAAELIAGHFDRLRTGMVRSYIKTNHYFSVDCGQYPQVRDAA